MDRSLDHVGELAVNATTTVAPCSRCNGPAEYAAYARSFIDDRLLVFMRPEQTLRGDAVCARCFLESEDR